MNHEKIIALCDEGKEAAKNRDEFIALAKRRDNEQSPLAAEAARESARSWDRAVKRVQAAITAEINAD
jgi:hypothetical protein